MTVITAFTFRYSCSAVLMTMLICSHKHILWLYCNDRCSARFLLRKNVIPCEEAEGGNGPRSSPVVAQFGSAGTPPLTNLLKVQNT